jgi:hypothetical protein
LNAGQLLNKLDCDSSSPKLFLKSLQIFGNMRNLKFLAVVWLAVLCCGRLVVGAVEQTPHTRKYFYVGGEYVTSTTGDHVMKNEMYVEELTPVGGSTKPFPLMFIHGLGQTGTVSQFCPSRILQLLSLWDTY